jgi:hypothetical protein
MIRFGYCQREVCWLPYVLGHELKVHRVKSIGGEDQWS